MKSKSMLCMLLLLLASIFNCTQQTPSDLATNNLNIGTTDTTVTGNSDPEKPIKWIARKAEAVSRINSTSADSYENDDTASLAKLIIVNGSIQEKNFFDDPTDWVTFTAISGRTYKLESWVYEVADTKFYLYSSGNLTDYIAYNDDKYDGTYGSFIQWTCPATGTYYLRIDSYGSNTGVSRAYELNIIDNTIAGDTFEEDDTLVRANRIFSEDVQSHNFADDANDYIYFYGYSSYTYLLESTVSGADTVFYLYDANGVQVAYNDDGGAGLGSKIYFTPATTANYYLKIYSYAGKVGAGNDYTVKMKQTNKMRKWTIMVYLDGDNNLAPYSVTDVNEMIAAGYSNDVNVIVLWDDMATRHGYYSIENGSAVLIQDLGEINMGSQTTVTNFITYVLENYPANHYFIDFWNHGGGPDRSLAGASRGVCWDDTNGGDHLSEVELKNALSFFSDKIEKNVEIIGFDACLMSAIEVAYQFRNYADYLVGSEELEPGNGWDYNFLSALRLNPDMSAQTLAQNVHTYYANYYRNSTDVTFAVLDLGYAYTLGSRLNSFSSTAINSGISGATFRAVEANAEFFDDGNGGEVTRDLKGYMQQITGSASFSAAVKTAANDVITTLDTMVLSNWSRGYAKTIGGISIVMKADTATYSLLDLCANTQWDEFLTFGGF